MKISYTSESKSSETPGEPDRSNIISSSIIEIDTTKRMDTDGGNCGRRPHESTFGFGEGQYTRGRGRLDEPVLSIDSVILVMHTAHVHGHE